MPLTRVAPRLVTRQAERALTNLTNLLATHLRDVGGWGASPPPAARSAA